MADKELRKTPDEAVCQALSAAERARKEKTDAAAEEIRKLSDDDAVKADGGTIDKYKCIVDLFH